MNARQFFPPARVLLMLCVASCADAQLLGPQVHPEQIARDATNVLGQTMATPEGIPQSLLADAQGIVIVPNMLRGAFVVGVQHGRGVLLTRGPQGAWQSPRMISVTGGSIGYQIGVQATDLILVFRTQQSVANLLNRTIKIGVDASAAAGPVGRQASAATDLPMQAEILSYSRARGAFIGVSIDGSSISIDPPAEAVYYQPPNTVPASAVQLIQAVTAYSSGATADQVVPATTNPTGWRVAAPGAPGEFEAARQQLDATARQLAGSLNQDWQRYLALPPEAYVPNSVPSAQSIDETLARYDQVSRRQEYAALASRVEFQETLRSLQRVRELQQRGGTQPLQLPPPPSGANAP